MIGYVMLKSLEVDASATLGNQSLSEAEVSVAERSRGINFLN
ncbi:MAG: hypothetical protein SFV55_13480 [Haliscomenobacter sp.]|nr:hypothetical protein [Haliscomenobacter sp.]MDX2069432.1 hypothetical protein [Haliscomenobacter sp.]